MLQCAEIFASMVLQVPVMQFCRKTCLDLKALAQHNATWPQGIMFSNKYQMMKHITGQTTNVKYLHCFLLAKMYDSGQSVNADPLICKKACKCKRNWQHRHCITSKLAAG